MTKPIDLSTLDRILELAKLATQGPWFYDGYSKICDPVGYSNEDADDDFLDFFIAQTPCTGGDTATKNGRLNAEYIASVDPTTITAMAEELKEARQALAFYADKGNWYGGPFDLSIICPSDKDERFSGAPGGQLARKHMKKWGLE